MSDTGIRISADGKSAATGTDLEMVITSKYSFLKGSIAVSGTVSLTAFVWRTVTIAHNLGYIPMYQVLTKGAVFTDWGGVPYFEGLGGELYMAYYARADSTNVYIDCYETSNRTIGYKCFIYKDKGKL